MSDQFDRRSFITKLALAAGVCPAIATARLSGQAPTPRTNVRMVQPSGPATVMPTKTGSATFAVVLAQGQAVSGLKVGSLATQTDIKNRWPDGSIKLAILSCIVPSVQPYSITEQSASSGMFTPTWPTGSVTFTIGGVRHVASLPPYNGADKWLNGAIVNESRAVLVPMNGSTPHPLLRCVVDVRSYASGGHRVCLSVNSCINDAGAARLKYDVTVVLNNVTVLSTLGVVHPFLMRWRQTFDVNLTRANVVRPLTEFAGTVGIPTYRGDIPVVTYDTTKARFTNLLGLGDIQGAMGQGGGQPYISPYPECVAMHAVHPSQNTYDAIVLGGNKAGTWGLHLTEADGVTPWTIDNHPTFCGYTYASPCQYANPTMGWDGTTNNAEFSSSDGVHQNGDGRVDPAHIPSLSLVPYLLTGDRYYADEMRFWAAFMLLWEHPANRGNDLGLLVHEQPRALAWRLRELVDCATWLPDADTTFRNYFRSKAQNNFDWMNTYSHTPNPNPGNWYDGIGPLDTAFDQQGELSGPARNRLSMWENAYVAWAIYHANAVGGFTPPLFLLDKMLTFQVTLINDSNFRPFEVCPFWLATGPRSSGLVTYKATMADLHAYNVLVGEINGTGYPYIGVYGGEATFMLVMAATRGITNTTAARAFLDAGTVDGVTTIPNYIKNRPNWAITGV